MGRTGLILPRAIHDSGKGFVDIRQQLATQAGKRLVLQPTTGDALPERPSLGPRIAVGVRISRPAAASGVEVQALHVVPPADEHRLLAGVSGHGPAQIVPGFASEQVRVGAGHDAAPDAAIRQMDDGSMRRAVRVTVPGDTDTIGQRIADRDRVSEYLVNPVFRVEASLEGRIDRNRLLPELKCRRVDGPWWRGGIDRLIQHDGNEFRMKFGDWRVVSPRVGIGLAQQPGRCRASTECQTAGEE